MRYVQSFIRIFAFFISHISHTYICSIHIIYTGLCNLILSYHIMFHFRSFTFFFQFLSTCICHSLHIITYNKLILVQTSCRSYRAYTYTKVLIHILVLLSILYLFRSPIGVTELIPIRRYLYTYLYFYLSYTCTIELILVQKYP